MGRVAIIVSIPSGGLIYILKLLIRVYSSRNIEIDRLWSINNIINHIFTQNDRNELYSPNNSNLIYFILTILLVNLIYTYKFINNKYIFIYKIKDIFL